MSDPPTDTTTPTFYFWLLDVRPLWQGKAIDDAVTQASDALGLLTPGEAARARAFYFLRDAKLNVAASLLKRAFAARALQIPWREARFRRRGDPAHGKPAIDNDALWNAGTDETATDREGRVKPDSRHVDFNVSHQDGLVALVGHVGRPIASASEPAVALETTTAINPASAGTLAHPSVLVGVDITSLTERRTADARMVAADGFPAFVDMHAEVFSPADMTRMKACGTSEGSDESLDDKLRRFYAYWALKEAYVKMSGEALLADWLQEVEFVDVKVPMPPYNSPSAVAVPPGNTNMSTPISHASNNSLKKGEKVTGIGVLFRGKRVSSVRLALQAFGDEYLVATAVKGWEDEATVQYEYEVLDLEKDVYARAR